jgi:hypothetical protein
VPVCPSATEQQMPLVTEPSPTPNRAATHPFAATTLGLARGLTFNGIACSKHEIPEQEPT